MKEQMAIPEDLIIVGIIILSGNFVEGDSFSPYL
jgi:hypothetical protein